MATGKPPWSQQYQEVAALFHIGTTKAHPPIPDHLSVTARNFLMKCLQKEPNVRPKASELLQHPFVTGEKTESLPLSYAPDMNQGAYRTSGAPFSSNRETNQEPTVEDSMDMCELGSLSSPTVFPKKSEPQFVWAPESCDDDMCQIGERNDFGVAKENLTLVSGFSEKSFNPVSEPSGNWKCDFNGRLGHQHGTVDLSSDWHSTKGADSQSSPYDHSTDRHSAKRTDNTLSPSDPSLSEDEDEVTESKIKAFLDEKAWELKKLQTPLYEEFYNTMCGTCSPSVKKALGESGAVFLKLPPKGRSPNQIPTSTPCKAPCDDCEGTPRSSNTSNIASPDALGSQSHERKGIPVDAPNETSSPSMSFSEKERKWKEELDQELERKREMMRQAGLGGRTLSPKDRGPSRQRDRSRFASPAK